MKKLTLLLLLFPMLVLLGKKEVFAQTSLPDLSTVNVDNLTDAQIRQLMQRASSLGFTGDNRLEQMALSQGMDQKNIDKLKLRVEKIRRTDENTSGSGRNTSTQPPGNRQYSGDAADSLRKNRSGPRIFGEELFSGEDNNSFEPNLRMATPLNYIIGPDDELLIDITGDNEANYNLKVSPEGTVRLQFVGLIQVGGLTIEQATSKIKSNMARTYPGLKTGRTDVAINIGNPRSIKITILGEAVKPGSYTLSSFASVLNALYLSGGPTKNGSFRNIQVVRNNRAIASVDIYQFLLKGIEQNNIRLQDQDVINIPVYQTRVEISGEVKRPGLFEVKDSESLQDVIGFAGGFSSSAYTASIKVLKNTRKERRLADIDIAGLTTYKPENGDKFVIDKILERFENRVEIEGAVFRPGQYELEKGFTLKKLIAKAEGLKGDAFLNRGYISRLNIDNSLSLLSFDLKKILDGQAGDIYLQREDKITISSIFNLKDEYNIEIQGEVRYPGIFNYADSTSVADLIQMAGGFKQGATPDRIEVSRRVSNSDATSTSAITAQIFTLSVDRDLKLNGQPFILQPFDVVTVRAAQGYLVQTVVKIQGEVLYPGLYTIQRKDERISDLIKRAGGLTGIAFPEGASLNRTKTRFITDEKAADSLQNINRQGLKRLQQLTSVNDTTYFQQDSAILKNTYVGINMAEILRTPLSRGDLFVQDGDVITVPKMLQTVQVSGEILKPANIIYEPGKKMRMYINESGNFSTEANKKAAYVIYSNGSIRSARRFLFFRSYPEIKPGSEIFIPKRAPRTGIKAAEAIGVASALSSLALIIYTIVK